MYLETPLDRYECMKIPLSLIPQDIIDHYHLHEKALNGYIYMEIRKGVYGLPQAGILANKLLKKCLARHGYYEQPHTPGLGNTTSALSDLISQLTTLESYTLGNIISNTSTMPYGRKHTTLLRTALATSTVASTSSGIMTRVTSTSQCQNMSSNS
jgi:hypothetical protein